VPASGWKEKLVALLAIDLTFPQRPRVEATDEEPWTLTSRWEETLMQKMSSSRQNGDKSDTAARAHRPGGILASPQVGRRLAGWCALQAREIAVASGHPVQEDAYQVLGLVARRSPLAELELALAVVRDTGERIYEAELCRLKGNLLRVQSTDHAAEAETCWHQALASARRQHAKSLELRAAMSLAQLWQRQGKRADAYDLLAPI
jgi:hypothetical protein